MAVLLLGLLSVLPKLAKSSLGYKQLRHINADILYNASDLLLIPLHNRALPTILTEYPDGQVCTWLPILASYIPDHMTIVMLYGIQVSVCHKSNITVAKLRLAEK